MKKKTNPQNKEFYVKIVGAGTKEGVLANLKDVIAEIEGTKLKDLREPRNEDDGSEYSNVVLYTGHPTKYYDFEE